MKQAFLLHGTDDNAHSNWLPWLANELTNAGWRVWVPDLPQSHEPNIARYNEYIFTHAPWEFDDQTVIIGHSSGAVEVLGLLQQLPENVVIKQAILVGSFKDDLGWPNLGGLFEKPFDFDVIRHHAQSFLFIHSDNDPYCPLDHAKYLSEKLHGKLMVIPGQKHFSIGTDEKYIKFPLLAEILLPEIAE